MLEQVLLAPRSIFPVLCVKRAMWDEMCYVGWGGPSTAAHEHWEFSSRPAMAGWRVWIYH